MTLADPQLRLPHSCVFCKGGYLEIRPVVGGLGSRGPWYPPFENHKGWGSLSREATQRMGQPARPQFAGWQALHVAIDDHSRLAFSRMLPNQQSQTAIAFLRAALAFYAQHGISIRRLLTDNGSCYRSRHFRAACLQLGIQHRFTRPYTPRTNGKAERFIQTALREWAYVRHYLNSAERDQHLSPWLEDYNLHRPHASLGYAPPISRAAPAGTTS
jgi:transposase InsO family protein